MLYAECDLMDFIKAAEPHEYLSGFNRFIITEEARKAIEGFKLPSDLESICSDLKVCGRREFSDLLKLRLKYTSVIDNNNKLEKEKKREEIEANRPPKT